MSNNDILDGEKLHDYAGGSGQHPAANTPHFRDPEEDEDVLQNPLPEAQDLSDEAEDDPEDGEEDGELIRIDTKTFVPKLIRVLCYIALVFAASFAIAITVWKLSCDVFGFGKPDEIINMTITEKDSYEAVIEKLVDNNMIDYPWLFRLFGKITHAEEKISVGNFELNRNYDYHAIINGLRANAATREVVTVSIPEGYTSYQIYHLLEDKGVCSVEELEATAASYEFSYSFLEEVPYGDKYRLEGYLFPDTYEFYVDDKPERVFDKFLYNFKYKFTEKLQEDISKLNTRLTKIMREQGFTEDEIRANLMDINSVMIVASLVEKETGGTSESAAIASYIYNRCCSKTYPLLQIESTIRYALNQWKAPLTAEELAYDSPYNTNRYPGLPQGPICNPGINSIRAAIYPRDTRYLFYAEDPSTGMHHFSETYYDHIDYLEGLNEKAS